MIFFSLVLALLPSANAAEWWVPVPGDREPLAEALDALWGQTAHQIVVGAAWSREIEVVWVAGYVNRFEEGELVARSPAPTARTAVALARSWFTEDRQRTEWLPAPASAFDLDIELGDPTSAHIVETTGSARERVVRRPVSVDARLGPAIELQTGMGSGLRTSFHDPVGGELELIGWVQPALVRRAVEDLPPGSWIAFEMRGALLLDFLPGEGEVRLGPSAMTADFGGNWRGQATQPKALGGAWAGGRARVELPVRALGLGGDVHYQVPVYAFGRHSEEPVVGRLSRLAAASAVFTAPLGAGRLQADVGGYWRLEPEAEHATPLGPPVRVRLAWMIAP